MVGHTGHFAAAVCAVSAVDLALERIKRAVDSAKGILLVTADHGNADEMYMIKKGQVETAANGRPLLKTATP